jgi:hypothetical protein
VLLKWRETFRAVSCFVFRHSIHYLLLMTGLIGCTPPTRLKGSVRFRVNKISPTIFYWRFKGS